MENNDWMVFSHYELGFRVLIWAIVKVFEANLSITYVGLKREEKFI